MAVGKKKQDLEIRNKDDSEHAHTRSVKVESWSAGKGGPVGALWGC